MMCPNFETRPQLVVNQSIRAQCCLDYVNDKIPVAKLHAPTWSKKKRYTEDNLLLLQ